MAFFDHILIIEFVEQRRTVDTTTEMTETGIGEETKVAIEVDITESATLPRPREAATETETTKTTAHQAMIVGAGAGAAVHAMTELRTWEDHRARKSSWKGSLLI